VGESVRNVSDANNFRRIALNMEGAVEGSHMNHPDFRANGRIFATLHPGDIHGMVKLTPEQQLEFIKAAPESFTPASGAWGRQGCTIVTLATVDEETLGEAMTLAWQNSTRPSSAKSGRARRPRARGGRKQKRRR
jgi:hypothetical protein